MSEMTNEVVAEIELDLNPRKVLHKELHVGNYLKQMFKRKGLSEYKVAKATKTEEYQIKRLLECRGQMNVDLALRLERAGFGKALDLMQRQMAYEIKCMRSAHTLKQLRIPLFLG